MSQLPISRRQLIKLLTAAAGTAVLSAVPDKWKTPVVEASVLAAQPVLSGFGTLAGYAVAAASVAPVSHAPVNGICTIPLGGKILGVTVSVDGFPSLSNTSDQNGFYVIPNVPAGARNFTATLGQVVHHGSGTIPVGGTLCMDWSFVIACLSGDTRIDTPQGAVRVSDMRPGMPIWTLDATGLRVPSVVAQTVRRPVPSGATIVHLELSDGRAVQVSAAHPTTDGRTIGDLAVGDLLDGARVIKAETLAYDQPAKYDVLPDGETGSYWANGIPMNSTIEVRERKTRALA